MSESIDLTRLPLPPLSLSPSSTDFHCELCQQSLLPGSFRCECGIVNFSSYTPSPLESERLSRLFTFIETCQTIATLRNMQDLPMRSVHDRAEECCVCGKEVNTGYKCTCGGVCWSRYVSTKAQSGNTHIQRSAPENQPKTSYFTVSLIALVLLGITIFRKFR